MLHRSLPLSLPLLAASFPLLVGCGGKVIIDQGVGGNPGDTGAGGQASNSSSADVSVTSGTGTTTPCGGIPNDCCATAIDATKGGTFDGTTCGADATFKTTGQCGPIGSPDAFYLVNPFGGFFSYQIDVTSGFYIMATADPQTCDAPSGCPFDGSSGVLYGETPLYIAVQRADGQCGPFEITFKLAK